MTIPRKVKLLLIAVTCLVAGGWWGYRTERRSMDAAGAPQPTVRSVVKRLFTPADQRAGVDRLEELRQLIGRSDPSRREIAALWNLVRGFSVDEVKGALELLPPGANHPVNDRLFDMLYFRWAQLEPEAAAQAALAVGNRSYPFLNGVLSAWAERDLDAAVRWARESGHPMAERTAAQIAARKWIAEDPGTALSRVQSEFPEAIGPVVQMFTRGMAGIPESRRELFAALARDENQGLWRQCASQLAFAMTSTDAAAMQATVDEMTTAGAPREAVEVFRLTWRMNYSRNGSEALLEMPPGSEIPGISRQATYASWAINDPDKAITWAEKKGETGFISSAVQQQANSLLGSDWVAGREDHAWAASLCKQYAAWQRQDPQAAGDWLATMPGDLKKLVSTTATPTGDATH